MAKRRRPDEPDLYAPQARGETGGGGRGQAPTPASADATPKSTTPPAASPEKGRRNRDAHGAKPRPPLHEERSAGFVIYHRPPDRPDDEVYLLLDYGRHWDFPKGHVHKGEDDLAAAVRELREETGIRGARVDEAFRREITYFFRKPKGLIRKAVVFFLAEAGSREVILSHEHVGFVFLPYGEAMKKTTFASARQVLQAARQYLHPPESGATE